MKKIIIPQLSDALFEKFSSIIDKETGILYQKQKKLLLSNRIKKRIKYLKLKDYSDYYKYFIKNKQTELKKLFNVITTNETHFFRHKDYFDLLNDILLEKSTEKKFNNEIFIWSAGCSSGEEPYSIAIIIDYNKNNLNSKFKILGTDISSYILEKAKAGIYTEKSFIEIDKYYRDKYFKKIIIGKNIYYEINKNIKNMVKFRYLNLVKDEYPVNVDIIFCRNVLIYMDKKVQKGIINKFYRALKPNGYLFLGASELLLSNDKFIMMKKGKSRVYKKT